MNHYAIVVAVANPDTVARLMRTASLIAKQFEGRIIVTNVVTPAASVGEGAGRADRMTRAYRLVEQAEAAARNWGVPCESVVSVGEQVHEVIVDVAAGQRANLIVAGFSQREEPSLQYLEFDRIIDALAAEAPCHLLVARFRGEERFDRVLVPIGSQRNLELTRDVVRALHYQAGASVEFLNFARDEQEAASRLEEVRGWLEQAGISECGKVVVEISGSPNEAVVKASPNYDVVIVGTAPLHMLRQRLLGSAAEYAANHALCTTFLVRRHEQPVAR